MRRLLLRSVILAVSFVFFSFSGFSQEKISEMKMKVFFHCANGKALLEREMKKVEGIKEFTADLQTKVCTIKYDENKTDKNKIIAAVEKIGYYTEFTKKDAKINKACSHDHDDHKHEHEHEHKH